MLSLSPKALYCTSSKCTNRKTTPRMVSIRLDFTEKISKNQIASEHNRWEKACPPIQSGFIQKWNFPTCSEV